MSTITIQANTMTGFAFSPAPTAVYLRVYLLNSFMSSAGVPLQASAPDDKAWYKQVTCTLLNGSLSIPSFTLDSTTDGLDLTNARYGCFFYNQNGTRLRPFDHFTSFRLSHLTTPVSWADIRAFNFHRIPVVDDSTYSKLQIEALIAAHGGIPSVNDLTGAITIATGTSGSNFAASASGGTVTLNLPDAGASSRGVITTGTQTIAGAKTFTGVSKFGGSSLATETAWGNFNGTVLMAGGADSSSGSPSSSVVPTLAYQTTRSTGTDANPIIAYGFASYQSGGYGDLYGIYGYSRFTANMSGYPVTNYNKHGARFFVVGAPSNIPASANVYLYGIWAQAQRETASIDAIGAQLDPNNMAGIDAEASDFSIQNKTICIATNAGEGDNLNSAIIYSQGRRAAAFAKAWKFNPEAIYRHGIDFKDAYVTLVGTLTATNGSINVSGSGTKFLKQVVPGDALQINGVYSVVATVPSDTALTLAVVFSGTTYTGSVTKYVIPMRLATNSAIMAHSDNGNADYRSFYLAPNDVWQFDPDARGTIFGGFIGYGVTSAGSPLHFNTGSTIAMRIDGAGNFQTTIGGAGGASALPATPQGYVKFVFNGTAYGMPFYPLS